MACPPIGRRTFYLRAETEEEAIAWTAAIVRGIRDARRRDLNNSNSSKGSKGSRQAHRQATATTSAAAAAAAAMPRSQGALEKEVEMLRKALAEAQLAEAQQDDGSKAELDRLRKELAAAQKALEAAAVDAKEIEMLKAVQRSLKVALAEARNLAEEQQAATAEARELAERCIRFRAEMFKARRVGLQRVSSAACSIHHRSSSLAARSGLDGSKDSASTGTGNSNQEQNLRTEPPAATTRSCKKPRWQGDEKRRHNTCLLGPASVSAMTNFVLSVAYYPQEPEWHFFVVTMIPAASLLGVLNMLPDLWPQLALVGLSPHKAGHLHLSAGALFGSGQANKGHAGLKRTDRPMGPFRGRP